MTSLLSDYCSLQKNGKLYKSAGQRLNDVPVYSYTQIKDTGKLLAIKQSFSEGDKNSQYIDSIVHNFDLPLKFDIILVPASSSKLLAYFAKAVSKKYNIPVVSDAFIKSLPNEITFSTGDVILDEKTLLGMIKIIENAKKTGKFELKKVKPIQFRKFFTNLMKANTDLTKIADKKVLLVDDIITSGSTLNDIFITLMRYGADDVMGLTLMKRGNT